MIVSSFVCRTLEFALCTCTIIFLTAQSSEPIAMVALHRGGEVILGAGLFIGPQSSSAEANSCTAILLPGCCAGRRRRPAVPR